MVRTLRFKRRFTFSPSKTTKYAVVDKGTKSAISGKVWQGARTLSSAKNIKMRINKNFSKEKVEVVKLKEIVRKKK